MFDTHPALAKPSKSRLLCSMTDPDISTQLSPAQQEAFDGIRQGMTIGSVLTLAGGSGSGKTTVLRELHRECGGIFLNMRDFVEASADQHPLALEETFYRMVIGALKTDDVVIVDDMHLSSASEGFTGSDLKRMIEDGKGLFAYDLARSQPPRGATEYFLSALETVRQNKERYIAAEAQAAQHAMMTRMSNMGVSYSMHVSSGMEDE
jgi:hypothetical protein